MEPKTEFRCSHVTYISKENNYFFPPCCSIFRWAEILPKTHKNKSVCTSKWSVACGGGNGGVYQSISSALLSVVFGKILFVPLQGGGAFFFVENLMHSEKI